jgi:hypothetical protein
MLINQENDDLYNSDIEDNKPNQMKKELMIENNDYIV